jgi:uncharacterized protein YbjT (DUF2867 family)
MILVTGARGNVARSVVQQLVAAGAPVRATSREPGSVSLPEQVPVVQVDLANPGTLQTALAGVRKIFLYCEPRGIDPLLEAARTAGVEQVVLLSSSAVVDDGPESPIAQPKREVEEAIAKSELRWTFLRPREFATNALRWAPMIRAQGVVWAPYPETHAASIHERDIAAVAVRILLDGGHDGASYLLTGPASLTQRQQVQVIADAIGRPVRFQELSPEQARERMLEQLGPTIAKMSPYAATTMVDALLGILARNDGNPLPLADTVRELTGRRPSTFAEWAADHAADFR